MKGHVYCVYDAASPTNGEILVKCGKTKTEPVAYCRRTYARHMGKPTIAHLAAVDDITYAEQTLFLVLRAHRMDNKHEVFAVPTLDVVGDAFQALVQAFGHLHKACGHLAADMVEPTESFLLSRPLAKGRQKAEKKKKKEKVEEERKTISTEERGRCRTPEQMKTEILDFFRTNTHSEPSGILKI